jgi:hypothetical protein
MVKKLGVHASALRGLNRLTTDGIFDPVEAMHYHIASVPGILSNSR